MKNKSADLKRLIIYLVLAFGISWVPWIILNSMYGFEEWFSGGKAFTYLWVLLISGGGPAIANVLTRFITKEGFDDDMLRLKLRGNVKYYIIAVAVPLAAGVLRGLMYTLLYGDISGKGSGLLGASLFTQAAPVSLVMAFNTFGEEYGWRGYMNGKLEALTNKSVTIVLGGIIWGVWHAPLTVCGHNFGTDYPGFPWLGIVLMSVVCIFTGMFLMWLTQKTGSIYPAAIAHSSNNNGCTYMAASLVRGIPEDIVPTFSMILTGLLPLIPVYAVFGVMLFKGLRKNTSGTAAAQ